jgi:hypothetical protein
MRLGEEKDVYRVLRWANDTMRALDPGLVERVDLARREALHAQSTRQENDKRAHQADRALRDAVASRAAKSYSWDDAGSWRDGTRLCASRQPS